jgi:hypothetical protein
VSRRIKKEYIENMLEINTIIPTVNGWKEIKDIKIGDNIFDEAGNICKVIDCTDIINTDCYRVKFSDEAVIICSKDHLWKTSTAKDRRDLVRRTEEFREKRRSKRLSKSGKRSNYKTSVLGAPELSTKTTEEIYKSLFYKKVNNHSIRACNPLILPDKELPIDPYVLGVWLGDGTKRVGAITSADEEVLEYFKKAGFEITKHVSKYGYGVLGLHKLLRINNLLCNKHIPKDYLRASIEQREELFKGLMDTDGCSDQRGALIFRNTNKRIIDDTAELMYTLGIKFTVREGDAVYNKKVIGKQWSMKFLYNKPCFKISRKLSLQKLDKFKGVHDKRYICEIDNIYSAVRGIKVNSINGSYLISERMITTY